MYTFPCGQQGLFALRMNRPYLCAKCRQPLDVSESPHGTAILVKEHWCDDRNLAYNNKLQTVHEYLLNNESATSKDIAELMGEQIPNATRYLYDLLDKGVIARDTTVTPYQYYIINDEQQQHKPVVVKT